MENCLSSALICNKPDLQEEGREVMSLTKGIIIVIMKYLLSVNLYYIPELDMLLKKKKQKKKTKARTVQQQ